MDNFRQHSTLKVHLHCLLIHYLFLLVDSCYKPTVYNGFIVQPPEANGRYAVGAQITFRCYSGYTLHGEHNGKQKNHTCLENYSWDPAIGFYCIECNQMSQSFL